MDMPIGTVSLEESATVEAGPTPAAPIPEPTPPAPVAESDAEPEETTVTPAGQKLVPLEALQRTRAELKAAKALETEVAQLRGQAQTGQQLQQWVETVKPLLAKLKDRPDVVAAIMEGKAPPVAAQPAAPDPGASIPDADAAELARELELFTAGGELDLVRARKIYVRQMRMAASVASDIAARATAPIQQRLAAGTAQQARTQYLGVKDKQGRSVNPQVLDQMWSMVPAELIEKEPNVAGVLYYAAKGYAAHHGLDEPVPPARAPLVSESPGGGTPDRRTLTDLDRAIMRTVEMSDKTYAERAANYKPGAINVLE